MRITSKMPECNVSGCHTAPRLATAQCDEILLYAQNNKSNLLQGFVIIAFFCYCALEQTCGLWASSYLVLRFDIEEEMAALFASLFYLGITIGRFINGFLTMKYSDKVLIRCGMVIILIGIINSNGAAIKL